MEKEIIKKFTDRLDDLVKLRGFLELIDGIIIKNGLEIGYRKLQDESPETAKELIDLIEAYLQYDKIGMIDEAADILGSIVKLLAYGKSFNQLKV